MSRHETLVLVLATAQTSIVASSVRKPVLQSYILYDALLHESTWLLGTSVHS